MFEKIKAPAIVGAILTALAGVLTAASTIPAAAFYATLGVSVIQSVIPAFQFVPGLTTFRVPAWVGVALTLCSAALVSLESIPAAALYATAAVSMINALIPLFRHDASVRKYGQLTATEAMHPKVEVPAYVGVVITTALALCSVLAGVPVLAPSVAGILTFLHTVSGYFTYAE